MVERGFRRRREEKRVSRREVGGGIGFYSAGGFEVAVWVSVEGWVIGDSVQ